MTNNFKELSVLITGGAGFIGSHLAESLLAANARVNIYDNFDPYYPREFKEANLAAIRSAKGSRIVEGDIRDGSAFASVLSEAKPDVVIHLAAKAGVRPSLANPAEYADVNVKGTTVVLEAARQAGIRDLIFASSSSVYGIQDAVPFRETDSTDRPLSPYGATKKAGEALCHAYHYAYGMSIACLRFFTVYGPRQRPDLAIRKFVRAALRGEPVPVFGDGTSARDYTHAADITGGILGAVDWIRAGDSRFGIFNLGSAHPVTLGGLLTMIEETTGKRLRRERLPMQPGDMPRTFADTSRAEAELGFRHNVAFGDGLRDFIDWMRRNDVP